MNPTFKCSRCKTVFSPEPKLGNWQNREHHCGGQWQRIGGQVETLVLNGLKAKTFSAPTVLVGTGGPTEKGYHQFERWLRCAKEDQLSRVRRIVRPAEQTSDALAIGSFFHAGRAMWFRLGQKTDGKTWQKITEHIAKEADNLKRPNTGKALATATGYVKEYCNFWALRPSSRPTIKAIEYKLGPGLFAPTESEDVNEMRTARLDDLGLYQEAGGKLVIGECKTTSGSINDVVSEYTLHGQIMLQQLLYKHTPQGQAKFGPISGTVLDICVKGYGGKRCQFAREFIPLRPVALQWFQRDLLVFLSRFSKTTWNTQTERRTTSCTRRYGRMLKACDYRELCMHGRSATGGYRFEDGRSLLTWKPEEGMQVHPWV